MDVESMNDKYSVKNLLFYRAIPPYVIPEPTNGYKIYGCTDCGDRFIFESSYHNHINRRSVKITYSCRRCPRALVFYNRCNLLSHIRSHSFKTATINVADLKIEPVPLSFFKIIETPQDSATATANATTTTTTTTTATATATVTSIATQQQPIVQSKNTTKRFPSTFCYECNENITSISGQANKDRVAHYMKVTNKFYSCPVCSHTLNTVCALKSHLRIHLRNPPYFCTECGGPLPEKTVNYLFYHNCEVFKVMRSAVKMQCPIDKCRDSLFHPSAYKKHIKSDHMKKVYKCPECVVACFSETTINKHLASHQTKQMDTLNNKVVIFYQCEMCPGRLVLQGHLEGHMNTHIHDNIYPCQTCGVRLSDIPLLIGHHINAHVDSKEMKNVFKMVLQDKESSRRVYRVVKKCDQCLRSFTYKCKYNDIKILPNACPYRCTSKPKKKNSNKKTNTKIKCPLCDNKIEQKWEEVKKHFALNHKSHKCLDAKVTLLKMDTKTRKSTRNQRCTVTGTKKRKIRKKKIKPLSIKPSDDNVFTIVKNILSNSKFSCNKCHHDCKSQEELEIHIKDHRDPCMAYQCMECGECFVVKPSFSTHLLLEHGISKVDEYIETKQCYNDDALIPNTQQIDCEIPLSENQCNICRENFDDSEELKKHYRVHGMAFLIKNSQNKPVSA